MDGRANLVENLQRVLTPGIEQEFPRQRYGQGLVTGAARKGRTIGFEILGVIDNTQVAVVPVMQISIVRTQLQRPLVGRHCLFLSVGLGQRAGQINMDFRSFRGPCCTRQQIVHSVVGVTQCFQGNAHAIECDRVAGVLCQHCFKQAQRGLLLPTLLACLCQSQCGIAVAGVTLQNSGKRVGGLIDLLQIQQCTGPVNPRRQVPRGASKGLFIALKGLARFAETAIQIGKIGDDMGLGIECYAFQKSPLSSNAITQPLVCKRHELPYISTRCMICLQRLQRLQRVTVFFLLQLVGHLLQHL